MTTRRQRKWINEFNTDTLVADAQDDFTIASTGFDKGETVVRMLLGVSTRPTVLSVDANVTLAVWVGQFGGIPTNIAADSPESYMMWTGYIQHQTPSGGEAIVYKTFDLRGQRASRSDSENIHFVYKVGSGTGLVISVWSRVLVLLP